MIGMKNAAKPKPMERRRSNMDQLADQIKNRFQVITKNKFDDDSDSNPESESESDYWNIQFYQYTYTFTYISNIKLILIWLYII